MDSQTVTLTLPFTAQQFWVFTIALSLIALSAGIVYVAGKRVEKERLPKDWLRDSLMIAGGLLAPIWAALLFMVLSALWHLAWEMPDVIAKGSAALRWHTLAIVGMITTFAGILGAPLAMIRVVMTERQTRATEEGLITDRINKAVEGLGAVQEIERNIRFYDVKLPGNGPVETRIQEQDGPIPVDYEDYETLIKDGKSAWQKAKEMRPNMAVRLGALESLRRIAEDSPRDVQTVARLMTHYVRDNLSRNTPKLPAGNTPHEFKISARMRLNHIPTADGLTALNILQSTRHNAISDERIELANARFIALDLRLANLASVDFTASQLDYCSFSSANIGNSSFKNCTLNLAVFSRTNLQNCHFRSTDCLGTFFNDALLFGAKFTLTFFDKHTTFGNAKLRGAAFQDVMFPDDIQLAQEQIDQTFGDGSVTLPPRLKRPAHWPEERLGRDFRTQWRAWQRSIGFQPDENQQ